MLSRCTARLRRIYTGRTVLILALFFMGALCPFSGLANEDPFVSTAYVPKQNYQTYLSGYENAPTPDNEVIIPAVSFSETDMEIEIVPGLDGYEGPVIKTDEDGYIEWQFELSEAGLYNVELTYYPLPGRGLPIQREIQINGEALFSGADLLIFHRLWGNAGPIIVDTAGNEIRPPQIEKPAWQTVVLRDSVGYEPDPYQFYFRAGTNRIRINSLAEPMALASLRIFQSENVPSYDEVMHRLDVSHLESVEPFWIKIQGEDATVRSSSSLFPVFDQGDPTVEPYHPAQMRLNSIGGHRWQYVGDWISWEFEVPTDGLYEIAIKAKQDEERGTYSTRKVIIDGKVPFSELQSVEFQYSSRYEMVKLSQEDNQPFLFYLTKGKHTLTMEVSLGRMAHFLREMEDSLYKLNTLYRNIIMVTSGNPDPLRSYQLDRRVPGLIEGLAEQAEVVGNMARNFELVTGERSGHAAVLRDFERMLRRMVDRPHIIPSLLAEFRDGIGSLGTWFMTARRQPLQIDYIVVASPGHDLPRARPNIFQVIMHELRAFAASFIYDYTSVQNISESAGLDHDANDWPFDEPLKVWIGVGRDQALVLKQMIEDTFTPETGIPVDLELVNEMGALLVPATIAGTAPDVAMGAANMDLAFRGAVVDLSRLPDFDEVASRFKKSALLPFRFRDLVFALPDTQSFPMLFYRKDILAELGLEVPQTWEDVYAIIPELQKNHLNFGLPSTMSTYLMFLYQKGVPVFKEDGVETNLEAEAAITTFREMTDLFVVYDLPLEFDFINRFRMGDMPIGIQDYSVYNALTVFAPELTGEWGFSPVPGTRQSDGTINRAVAVDQMGTSGTMIMQNSTKKDAAWEFLKWWTRTDTQVRFGREMESLMGAAARYATANVEAMQQLPWTTDERRHLNEQWDWLDGVPPVLGGYYVTRQFDWLFRAIVLHNEPVRDTVLDYKWEIDIEIERKRREFNYTTHYEALEDRWKELYWDHYTHVYRLDWDLEEIDELHNVDRFRHLTLGENELHGIGF